MLLGFFSPQQQLPRQLSLLLLFLPLIWQRQQHQLRL
jgi:hypothetical protein